MLTNGNVWGSRHTTKLLRSRSFTKTILDINAWQQPRQRDATHAQAIAYINAFFFLFCFAVVLVEITWLSSLVTNSQL